MRSDDKTDLFDKNMEREAKLTALAGKAKRGAHLPGGGRPGSQLLRSGWMHRKAPAEHTKTE